MKAAAGFRLDAPKALPRKAARTRKPKAKAARAKVWTGARKKIAVSSLQLVLPGIGGKAL